MSHVLVVDADKTVREQIVAVLAKTGYSVSAVASAQSAVASCEEQKPDVIVLELQLRGHSGVEFIHELRSYPEWQNIPVVLYTLVPWSSLERFADSFKAMGIMAYAYKPETTFKKLLNILEETFLVKQ